MLIVQQCTFSWVLTKGITTCILKAISEEQMDNILDDRPVGFLSYNTYHQLKHSLFPGKKPGFDNIVATETFCIHLQELPTGFALRQNRKISDNVWDACYRKGISLA